MVLDKELLDKESNKQNYKDDFRGVNTIQKKAFMLEETINIYNKIYKSCKLWQRTCQNSLRCYTTNKDFMHEEYWRESHKAIDHLLKYFEIDEKLEIDEKSDEENIELVGVPEEEYAIGIK